LLSSLLGASIIQAGARTYWYALAIAMVCAFAGLAWAPTHYPKEARRESRSHHLKG
jgi:phosphate/sulfate permease